MRSEITLPSGSTAILDRLNPEVDLKTLEDARHVEHLLRLKLQTINKNSLIQAYLATQKNLVATELAAAKFEMRESAKLLSAALHNALPSDQIDIVIAEYDRLKSEVIAA